MCIIVAKNKEVDLPKIEYLYNCFENNKDGAGLMYVKNDKVIIEKGFMTWKSFKNRYKKLCKKYNNFEGKSLVFHFRIGTSGNIDKGTCHPFPITSKEKYLKSIKVACKLGLVHNGILHDYVKDNDLSDTQNFVKNYLASIYKNYNDFYTNKFFIDDLGYRGKFVLLDNKDNLYITEGFEECEGVLYSNDAYKWSNNGYIKETTQKQYDTYGDYNYNYDYDYSYKLSSDELIPLSKGYFLVDDWGYTEEIKIDNLYFYDSLDNVIYKKSANGKLTFYDDTLNILTSDYTPLFTYDF